MSKDDLNLVQGEIQASVSFTAFMTAVSLFFVGLLITQTKVLDPSVNVPILFLIISTFGFLYSTLIFANASGKIARLTEKDIKRDFYLGNILSEYFGVYLLILSIPLVINIVTADTFLKVATMISALGGLIIYHGFGFSIMERYVKRWHYPVLSLIVLFEIAMYFLQFADVTIFSATSALLLLLLVVLCFFSKD